MKNISIFIIRLYQRINPLLQSLTVSVFGFAHRCKQSPSCSEYTIQAIQRYGTMRGALKGFWRVLHCI